MAHRNILLLIADDLGRTLSCYGETAVRTPHINALAAEAVRFDGAFASTASCSGSRSVIYTGLHTHQNGQYGLHHAHHHFMTFEGVETAPKLMADRGYLTGIIGKVHVGPEQVYPWEVRDEARTRDVAWMAARAGAFFERAQAEDRPFFLTLGYIDPHRDTTRSGFGNDRTYPDVIEEVYAPEDVNVPFFLTDLPEVRFELAEYYRSISRLDQGVGMVLRLLEREGLSDTTLVCFVSDNGSPFLNSKTTLYDAGVHLPLIMRVPERANGLVNPNLVSFVDLLPTFLDWSGDEDAEGGRDGRSILPVLDRSELQADRQRIFGSHNFHEITNYYPTRFLRTPRYKYHRNVAWKLDFPFSGDLYGSLSWEGMRHQDPVKIGDRPLHAYIRRPPEELYDMQADPKEVRNLAGDPEHASLLAELRGEMEAWQQRTDDPWLYRDGVSLRAIRHHLDAGMTIPDRFDYELEAPGSETR